MKEESNIRKNSPKAGKEYWTKEKIIYILKKNRGKGGIPPSDIKIKKMELVGKTPCENKTNRSRIKE